MDFHTVSRNILNRVPRSPPFLSRLPSPSPQCLYLNSAHLPRFSLDLWQSKRSCFLHSVSPPHVTSTGTPVTLGGGHLPPHSETCGRPWGFHSAHSVAAARQFTAPPRTRGWEHCPPRLAQREAKTTSRLQRSDRHGGRALATAVPLAQCSPPVRPLLLPR